MMKPSSKPWRRNSFAFATLLLWGFALLVAPWAFARPQGQLLTFVAAAGGMLVLFITLGFAVNDSPHGILLNGRNTFSLSQLQMVAWTTLALSALTTVAVCRAWQGYDALAISIPNELLEAMGISFASAAAAPALLSLKRQTASDEQVMSASSRLGEAIVPSGQVVGRSVGAKAKLLDFVTGDELANAGMVDLSKVQQLLITALLIAIYADMLGTLFAAAPFDAKLTELPKFSESFVNLMAVSHGGYLAYKATAKPAGDAGPQLPEPPDRNAGIPA